MINKYYLLMTVFRYRTIYSSGGVRNLFLEGPYINLCVYEM